MSSFRWRAANSAFFPLSQLRRSPSKLDSLASSEIASTTTSGRGRLEPPSAERQKHILIVGGAYSGLSTIITLQKILSGAPHDPGPYNLPPVPRLPRVRPRVTLLDERDGCYHTVGKPLAHTSPDVSTAVPRAWKRFADIPYLEDVAVVRGSVQHMDPLRKTVVYTTYGACIGEQQQQQQQYSLSYNYIVCATGLKRDWPAQPRAMAKAEYIRDATALVQGLADAKEGVVVVGGGLFPPIPFPFQDPKKLSQCRGGGNGFAGELKLTYPGKVTTLVHSRSSLLSSEPLPEEFKAKALKLLEEIGVEVLFNTRMETEADGGGGRRELVLSTGTVLRASAVLWCVGRQQPSAGFLPESTLHSDSGLVRVSASFNLPQEVPNHTAHLPWATWCIGRGSSAAAARC